MSKSELQLDDVFSVLREGFRYDKWANEKWMRYVTTLDSDAEKRIFQHTLSAQEVWLRRLHGESPTSMPEPEICQETLDRLHRGWIESLSNRSEDVEIDYKNTQGLPNRERLSRIARHVIDHGTYHRGELRGLCLTREAWDFPETGFISYCMAERG